MAVSLRAYPKTFVATAQSSSKQTNGFVSQAGVDVTDLLTDIELGKGTVGFFDKNDKSILSAAMGTKPFYIGGCAVADKDKIGSIGGYQAPNKTVLIDPKNIHKMYSVKPTNASNTIVKIEQGDCSFICEGRYVLFVEAKGTEVIKSLHHQAYARVSAYGGCCDGASTKVAAGFIFLQWAKEITNNLNLKMFVTPVLTVDGVKYYASEEMGKTLDPNAGSWNTIFDSGVETLTKTSITSTLELIAAIEDISFSNCSFKRHDNYAVDPILLEVSQVDEDGNPCYEQCLVITNTPGKKANGLGETKIRQLIYTESYNQNWFHDNSRKREILGEEGIFDVIDRTEKYYSFYIIYSDVRHSNQTSVNSNNQFIAEIVTNAVGLATLLPYMRNLATAAGLDIEDFSSSYNVTVGATTHGTAVSDLLFASEGDSVTITNTPATGYELDEIVVMQGETEIVNTNGVFTMPSGDVTVTVTFVAIDYNITVTPGVNGTVTANVATASIGETVTLTITPAATYEVDTITVLQGTIPVVVTNNAFTMPAGNVTVTVTFKLIA